MEQRELKFQALFENIDTGKRSWARVGIGHSFTYAGHFQVSPWLQYTGLKDCNGKEIYEGDVVRQCPPGSEVAIIKWGVSVDDEYGYQRAGVELWGRSDEHLIIGNIYENPELEGVTVALLKKGLGLPVDGYFWASPEGVEFFCTAKPCEYENPGTGIKRLQANPKPTDVIITWPKDQQAILHHTGYVLTFEDGAKKGTLLSIGNYMIGWIDGINKLSKQ